MIKFDTRVLKVEVREKTEKFPATREAPAYFETVRVGKLTLEFDGDHVDVQALSHFVGTPGTQIGLAETQYQLPGEFQS